MENSLQKGCLQNEVLIRKVTLFLYVYKSGYFQYTTIRKKNNPSRRLNISQASPWTLLKHERKNTMNIASLNGCNLITLGDRLIRHTNDENEALKATLTKLKKEHGALNYCVFYQIINDSEREIFILLESIQSLISDISEPEISDELKKIQSELECLREEHALLEKDFRTFLTCPALNPPEHQN